MPMIMLARACLAGDCGASIGGAGFIASDNTIIGNTVLYGATSGKLLPLDRRVNVCASVILVPPPLSRGPDQMPVNI